MSICAREMDVESRRGRRTMIGTDDNRATANENLMAQSNNHSFRQWRVLLVEDEPVTGLNLTEQLEDDPLIDAEITNADSLKNALNVLEQEDPDLVLLDLSLPDSQGLSTLDKVQCTHPGKPIIVLTDREEENLARQALHNGAQDYVVKGVDDGSLIRSVRYAIERARNHAALQQAQYELEVTRTQLIQVEKLDAVGRLASGIAHEIRNPLAVIQMGIDLLRETLPQADGTMHEVIEDMDEAIERSGSIISGLLEFCKPTEPNWQCLNLNKVIEEALPMVRHELLKRQVDLEVDLSDSLSPMTLDRRRIQEVVFALIFNAVDAMEGGGTLTIRTDMQTLGESDQESVTLVNSLHVKDTGPGIPVGALERVFEPFYTTKPIGSGTGLGLSIAKNLVELNGGTMKLKNRNNGTGAVASIEFVVRGKERSDETIVFKEETN